MSISKMNEQKKMLLVFFVDLLLIFGLGSMTPIGTISANGMKILGIFLGCIWCWLWGYLGWSSVLGLVVLAVWVPGYSINGVFGAAYGNSTLLMIVFCLIFCYGLSKIGLLSYISNFILSRKWAARSPWTLAVALWIAAIICSCFTNTIATTLLLYSIFYDLAKKLGIKPKSTYCVSVLILLSTFAAISIGLMPYSPCLLLPIGMAQMVAPEFAPNIFKVCLVDWILVISTLIIGAAIFKVLLAKNIIKTEFSLDDVDSLIDESDLVLTKPIKMGMFLIALMVTVVLAPSILPADNAIGQFFSKIGFTGIVACIGIAMSFMTQDGKLTFSFEESIMHGVPWGVYFMMATAYYVAGLVVTPDLGIVATVLPVVQGIVPTSNEYITVLIFLAILLMVTNCITNFVAMQMMVPIITLVLVDIGVDPMIYIGLVSVIVEHGNLLPSGSPVGAFMHGNSDWMTSGQVYTWAGVGSLFLILATALVGIPLLMLIY